MKHWSGLNHITINKNKSLIVTTKITTEQERKLLNSLAWLCRKEEK